MTYVEQCQKKYDANNCDNPTEFSQKACEEVDACRKLDPEKSIKTFNVLTRIVAEIFNDLTSNLSMESLGLMASILLIVMCCMGKCGCSRGSNGKV